MDLGRRIIPMSLEVSNRRLRGGVHRVVTALAAGGRPEALERLAALETVARRAAAAGLEVDSLRALALARLLLDLHEGGWSFRAEGARLYAVAPPEGRTGELSVSEVQAAKAAVRQAMMSRVREQLATRSVGRLVAEVEPAIQELMASGPRLAESLRAQGAAAVQPYLQRARGDDGRCELTGVRLHSAFRYFRFLWSFPAQDTPGRSIPFLIRDAGQPGHPVCGLLCLASPVLRLAVRDEALGLGDAWLQAMVVALDPQPVSAGVSLRRHYLDHLHQVTAALTRARSSGEAAPSTAKLLADLADALGSPVASARGIARYIELLGEHAAGEHLARARRGLVEDLLSEVHQTIALIDASDLGDGLDDPLADPAAIQERLLALGKAARERLQEARHEEGVARRAGDAAAGVRALREAGNEALFDKKRAVQLAAALGTLAGLQDLQTALAEDSDDDLREALRAHTGGGVLDQGASCSRASSKALLLRKVRIAATQLAEVSLCGAVPPYRSLLGGKLAALLALSRDVADAWFQAFDGQRSEIQSKLAGRDVRRPAAVLALSTTSLYAVGSAQYNRVRLPPELGGGGWSEVGHTAGHGTLHLSKEVSRQLAELLDREEGSTAVTGTFGEGPSERMRKLRDGLTMLGLPSKELLNHGMPRVAFVCSVAGGAQPGRRTTTHVPHHEAGPTAAEVAGFWRRRWLAPRLAQPGRLDEVAATPPPLLSRLFPDEIEAAQRALGSQAGEE